MQLKVISSLILAGLLVLFVIQNVAVVEIRFLVWTLPITLALLIFLLFAAGVIVGSVVHSYWAYRRSADARKLIPETERPPGAADKI